MTRLEATFFALQLRNLNPQLVMLAVERVVQDTISRFKLNEAEIDHLSDRILTHLYPRGGYTPERLSSESNNPGFKAAREHFEAVSAKLDHVMAKQGNREYHDQLDAVKREALVGRPKRKIQPFPPRPPKGK